MSKKTPSAPSAPDPAATAAAQAAANKDAVVESAKVNQINEVSPYGTLTYSGEIGSPDRTRTTSLNPTDQANLDQQRQLATALTGFGLDKLVPQVLGAFQNPLSFDNLPQIPGQDDLNAGAKTVRDAVFSQGRDLLQPGFDQDRERNETALVNRGLAPGSQAYTTGVDNLARQQNSALTNLANQAVTAGSAEQSRLFGLGQSARNQGISEATTLRSQPLNELAALLQGSPAIQSPQFQNAAQYQVAPADVTGATSLAYQGALNNYNTQQGANNAALGGLYGLAGAGLGSFLGGGKGSLGSQFGNYLFG